MWNLFQNNITPIVCLIVGLLISFLFMKNCSGEIKDTEISTNEKTVVVKLVTKIDTLYKKQNVYVPVPVPTTVTTTDTIYKEGTKELVYIPKVVREYADSSKVSDSVYVGYKAKVTGTLDKIDLTYSNRKSIVVIHRTDSVFTKTTITKPSRGLYIGASLGLNEISPHLQFVNNKNIYGVKYNIVGSGSSTPANFGVTYSRKLF